MTEAVFHSFDDSGNWYMASVKKMAGDQSLYEQFEEFDDDDKPDDGDATIGKVLDLQNVPFIDNDDETCENVLEVDSVEIEVDRSGYERDGFERVSIPPNVESVSPVLLDTNYVEQPAAMINNEHHRVRNPSEEPTDSTTKNEQQKIDSNFVERTVINDEQFIEINLVHDNSSNQAVEQALDRSLKAKEFHLITFHEALQSFPVSEVLLKYPNCNFSTLPTEERPFSLWKSLVNYFVRPATLAGDLLEEKNYVFSLAHISLQPLTSTTINILKTLFVTLTNQNADFSTFFGGHWTLLGFQGCDPGTDLRSGGILALLQLLYFITDSKTNEFSKLVYKLSLDPTQNFPFSSVGINFTVVCLNFLHNDRLNKLCNGEKSVLSALNNFYVALFTKFYKIWHTQKRSVADFGNVLNVLEKEAKSNTSKFLKSSYQDFKEFNESI